MAVTTVVGIGTATEAKRNTVATVAATKTMTDDQLAMAVTTTEEIRIVAATMTTIGTPLSTVVMTMEKTKTLTVVPLLISTNPAHEAGEFNLSTCP